MRPKDLKSDYKWETRKPYMKDQVLFVPDYYFEHQLYQMPALSDVFGNNAPVTVEFCSGNGDWIIEKALHHPDQNFIAVEMLFERVQKIYSKRENKGVKNLLIVCGEGMKFSRYYMSNSSVNQVFVNFPDPWPKARHAKHRIIKKEFLSEISRVLINGGAFTIATDDDDYCNEITTVFSSEKDWVSEYAYPYYRTDIADYGFSFFDALWREKGKTIKYMKFLSKKGL